MHYAIIKDGKITRFGLSVFDLRVLFPSTSFPPEPTPDQLPLGIVGYVESDQPAYDPSTKKVVETAPEGYGTGYRQTWTTVNLNPDELAIVAANKLSSAKAERSLVVSGIKITSSKGRVFDGDEISQDRMTRAITALDEADKTLWVLADNTVVNDVTRAELREVLRAAMLKQGQVWAAPYQG